jgi:hypothetical protein
VSHGGRPWRPPAGAGEGGRVSLSLSSVNDTSRPRLDQGLRLEDTLSAAILLEPLTFIILEPAVLGVIPEVHFFVLKTYFYSVI